MAKLYFRYGAMNSGKSTALMQVAHNYEEQGMRVLILKPKEDTKGSGDLVSRLGVRRPADLLVPPDMDAGTPCFRTVFGSQQFLHAGIHAGTE